MGRLTKYGKTSHENGVCCTHFASKECNEVDGYCSFGCKWEEEAWSKLAHYEDLEEQGRLIEVVRCKECTMSWEDTIYNRLICGGNIVLPDDYCAYGKLKELEGVKE